MSETSAKVYQKLCYCKEIVRKKTSFEPKIALVLGSGLGGLAETMDVVDIVDYKDIDTFPVSTIPGHVGRFLFGYLEGVPIVCMQGRVHYNEGYELSDVILPTRLMHALGAETLFLTNAAGGLNKSFCVGDLMIITDHIMTFFPNPLVGQNVDELGTRFPDMSKVYDEKLSNIIKKSAEDLGYTMRHGVYCQLTGPSFETPAEIRFLSMIGADAVGMSTACEAVAARHCGMKVCGVSCISNMGAGLVEQVLTHEDVKRAADLAADKFKKIIKKSVYAMYNS